MKINKEIRQLSREMLEQASLMDKLDAGGPDRWSIRLLKRSRAITSTS